MVNAPSPPSGATSALLASRADKAESLRELNSYLLSAVCHLLAFVLLGLLTAAARNAPHAMQLELQLGDGSDVFAGDEGALAGAEDLGETETESADAVETEQVFEFQAVATTEAIAVEAPLESLTEADAPFNDEDVAKQVDRQLASKIGHGGGVFGEVGDGAGEWSGRGSPSCVETGFFGIGDTGKSFVYVVDCSDSMNERNKFRRAKYELMHSLEQLADEQQYFVIFFSEGAYPMDADGTVAATEEHVAQTSEWISDVEANGGTNPFPALLLALAMQPDAIYFLTDGQFDPQIVLELRKRNRDNRRLGLSQIPIHTIAFGDRRAEGLMKSISRNSGGEYRFVK